jgi:hypothetical protein
MDKILKKYKNELLQILLDNGIDKNKLIKKESVTQDKFKYFTIYIKDTPFYFILKNNPDNFDLFLCEYNLFKANYPPSFIKDKWRIFIDIKPYIKHWIKEVKEYFDELTTIDLWEQLSSSSKILHIGEIDFDNKENFNEDEIKQIKLSLNELKLLIGRNFELQEEEKKTVNNRLDYLTEASNRLNKFDWKSLLINTVLNIIIALSFDSQKGKQLFELFGKVFSFTSQLLLGK